MIPGPDAVSTEGPVLSIIVPTRNRPGSLRGLFAALTRQSLDRSLFEVIVVNDGGDPLDPVIASFRDELAIRTLSLSRSQGCSGAREAGARLARGRLLVFTDDDCVPGPGWLEAFDRAHRATPHAGLGGPVRNGRRDSPLAEALQLVVNRFTAAENAMAGRPVYFPTNNVAFPRIGYEAAGGMDAAWRVAGGEDRDLCHRWVESGRRMAYVPDAAVEHWPLLTFRAFVRKFFAYGRGAVLHGRRNGSLRSRSERIRHAVSLPLRPFRSYPVRAAVPVSIMVQVSQLCTAAGVLFEIVSGRADGVGARTARVEVRT